MLSRLILKDFRNYTESALTFDERINLFIGQNGQGKTNLLEAIFFLSLLRSFRTSQPRDIKRISTNGFMISAQIKTKDGWSRELGVDYSTSRKLSIDGQNVAKASEFIHHIRAVAFSPDDIAIVTGNSGLRRRYLDMLIAALERPYLSALQDYSVALKSRNSVLRSGRIDEGVLTVYDELLAKNGVVITEYRNRYIKMLIVEIKKLLEDFGPDYSFAIKYKGQALGETAESYSARLSADRQKDILRRQTTFGPQLDDFELLLSSKLLRTYGSTGQCRLISLCLKMAQVNIFSDHHGEQSNLIVLVDDVTGELDQKTRTSFYQVINKAEQSFFTFTEEPSDDYFSNAAIYHINNGAVVE